MRRTDTDPGWINRKFRDLERQLKEQQAAKRLPGTEVESGSNFLVRGVLSVIGMLDLTGTVSMKSGDGVELIRMGDMTFGRGFEMKRDNGTSALKFRKPFSVDDQQAWGLTDVEGNLIVEQAAIGLGLGRPYLEHPFQPVAATSGTAVACGPYGFERTHASTSWATVFAYDGKAQNGFLDLKFAAMCSDGTTAGEIQIINVNTGLPLPAFLASPWVGAIPAGTTTMTLFDPTPDQVILPVNSGVGGQMRLGIQVRRTAGAGTITLSVAQAIGG